MAERHWLAGRVAVITGGSRGIGRATAVEAAALGAHTVLLARSGDDLEAVASEIRRAGGAATPVPTDVSVPEAVDRAFATAAEVGPPTALVCAAGTLRRTPLEASRGEVWDRTLAVNLTGTFLCCVAAFAAMRRAGGGRIVTVASLSGVAGTEKFPGLAAYNVSKYGVAGLTEAIAVEGRELGITAICVSPGAVDTGMLREAGLQLAPGLTAGAVARVITALLDDPLQAASGANLPLFSNR